MKGGLSLLDEQMWNKVAGLTSEQGETCARRL